MNKISDEIYYAKILLFGEYSVIRGSKALTIPYTHFNGELSFMNHSKYTDLNFAALSNEHLKNYAEYIDQQIQENNIGFPFDITALKADIANGMYFESTIPQGYGIGSSGALVAALYHKYAVNSNIEGKYKPEAIAMVKKHFSQLESYFHGTSSGLDPLNCYLKQPLLIKSVEEIETVEIPRNRFRNDEAIFLINSGKQGKTGPLVKQFLQKYNEPEYAQLFQNEYIPLNNKCIEALISDQETDFFAEVRKLSMLQLELLSPMIPASLKPTWQLGLDTDNFVLKLCGSGGGGFILGFTRNWEVASKLLLEMDIEPIPVYKHNNNHLVTGA